MKTLHTPGPWSFAQSDIDGRYSIYHNGPIAYTGDTTAQPGDGEANARLIAAAPDLLAALEDFVGGDNTPGGLGGHYLSVSGDAMRRALAAIVKARGEA